MSKLIASDYIGKTYGRLTGIKDAGMGDRYTHLIWQCECGNTVKLPITRVINGYVKSCGCYAKELTLKRMKKFNKYKFYNDYGVGYTDNGYEFYFDIDDYDKIKDYCWHKHKDGYLRTRGGIYSNGKNHYELMHRWILGLDRNFGEIDHINGMPNDNRKVNLRFVTHTENMKNVKMSVSNKSGHKGVWYSKRENKWKATITHDKQKTHLGTFKSYEEAEEARECAERQYFGDYARNPNDLLNGTRCP